MVRLSCCPLVCPSRSSIFAFDMVRHNGSFMGCIPRCCILMSGMIGRICHPLGCSLYTRGELRSRNLSGRTGNPLGCSPRTRWWLRSRIMVRRTGHSLGGSPQTWRGLRSRTMVGRNSHSIGCLSGKGLRSNGRLFGRTIYSLWCSFWRGWRPSSRFGRPSLSCLFFTKRCRRIGSRCIASHRRRWTTFPRVVL